MHPPADRMPFSIEVTAQPADIDELGHVNNTVYLRWVQDVATSHWRAVARPQDAARYIWVVTRHEIDYLRALQPDATVVARTWVGDPQGPRFNRYVRIEDGEGRLCAQGVSEWCLVEAATLRPQRIPATMLPTFEAR